MSKPFTWALMATVCAVALTSPAFAAEKKKDGVDIRSQVAFQYITEDNRDLNASRRGRDSSFSEFLQVSAKAPLADDVTGFANVRALNIDGDAGFEDDSGRTVLAAHTFAELRELWVRLDNIQDTPWAVQLGRQRIREDRAIWWNNDLDSVRAIYDTTLLKGFIGVGEDLASYRSNNDFDYQEDEKNRFRTLGELSWQYQYNHFLEGRFLFENDHSGLEPVGSLIRANDRDNEDQNAVWLGLRSAGLIEKPATRVEAVKYRADIIGLAGDSDEVTSTAGPGTDYRTVTGARSRDLKSWAFDGGATIVTDLPLKPAITLGYAYGSGDDNAADGTDHAFRQSDLQGSNSRIGLERSQQKNYGEVLRPELSNLHILTVGVGVPVSDFSDVSLTYFKYHLAEDNVTSLRSSGISAGLNGRSGDIGDAVDVGFNMDVDGALKNKTAFIKDVDFRVTLGSFYAGNAYEPNADKAAYRLFSELKFRF